MSTIQSAIAIRTSRLDLRELEFGDAEFILELLNEAGFIRFIGDKGVRTLSDARDYIQHGPMESYARNGFGLYAARLRDGTPIGICGLVKREGLNDPDVGFAFLSRYWSCGYAVESAAAVLAHARDTLRIKRVVAITSPDNWSSIAVLEKIGLKFERMIRLIDHSPELKLFGSAHAAAVTGAAVFVAGLAIRWYAIIYLGRFFTVNVAIARDHELIEAGPSCGVYM